MRAVGCEHDMDISGDFSIAVNEDGFKLSIGSDFEGRLCSAKILTLALMP